MANLTTLPKDLLVEILTRIPTTSMRAMRCTCKKWNTLSKNGDFTKKHMAAEAAAAAKEGEIPAVVLFNRSLHLMSVNLNDSDPSVTRRGNLTSLNETDNLNVSQVYHCEGLLLCAMEDNSKLVLWNPYSGQTRWILVKPRKYYHSLGYGYRSGKRSYKILRFLDESVHEIYNVSSNTWRVLGVSPDWYVDVDEYENNGVTVKGNTYWYAKPLDIISAGGEELPGFLLCFDFTAERFARRLPLPVDGFFEDAVVLSSFREEQQLAVLFQSINTLEMEVWVTSKVGPSAVSWSKFLSVDMAAPFIKFNIGASFMVDEEKRAVVVFQHGKAKAESGYRTCPNTAYFIDGDKGYLRGVDLGDRDMEVYSKVLSQGFAYVPSSLQINEPVMTEIIAGVNRL
ncbi:unnamed protein product [Microthlaspi erraticum]|uniref:F-box domain-containing protein n=1 Tax=Microthlaspi erraticum TaxID=1685480 RepID=A0A6D2KTC5_9BRAS|nr:unnamed protein product [Microthlaspi erraticum]